MSTIDESFCCMVLLKARDRMGAILALLPETRRGHIEKLVERMQSETEEQLRFRTQALRRPSQPSERFTLRFSRWMSRPF